MEKVGDCSECRMLSVLVQCECINASFISDIDETVQLSFTLLTSCLTLFLMAEGQMPDIFSTLIDGRRCRSGRTGFETEIEMLSIWFHGRYYTSYGI